MCEWVCRCLRANVSSIWYMAHPTSPEGIGIRRASSHPLNWVQVGHMWRSIVLCTAAVLNYCS